MLVLIGYLIVVVCVFGAFAISGGHLVLIFEPWHEYVIIAGAAFGGLIVKSNARTLKLIFQRIASAFKGRSPTKEHYLQGLKLIYDLAYLARREGLLALESHIQDPKSSPIFQKHPDILANQRLIRFITDNLKIVVVGGTSPADLETLMDADIETIEEENAAPQMLLSNTADALPALGIVAAVLGIIKTMASIAEGPEVVGMRVAAALVGTFLGVLLSYGFVGPLAMNLEIQNQEEARILHLFKAGILGIMRGMNPKLSAEYARRAIYEGQRPSFEELETALKG